MKSRPPKSAIVIGSGISGAAAAYFLARRGVDVEVIEASAPAAAATGAADGAVSVASKRPGPMMEAALRGIRLYCELAGEGVFADLFKMRSTFIVASSEQEAEVLHSHAGALASTGVRIERLSRAETAKRFPVLSPNAEMAVEVHDEGHAIGYRIVHRLLTASGMSVRRDEPVRRLLVSGGCAEGVETDRGVLKADAVILAAGSGSAHLLGLRDTFAPRKGQLLVTERAPQLNAAMPGAIMSGRYLLSKGSQKTADAGKPARGIGLVIDPLTTGQFLIGGTREDTDDHRTNDLDAVSRILADAVALVPGLAEVRLLRSFAGVRTAVVDGLPLIGRLPGLENAYVTTGFEGDGICLGPVAAKAVVELACDEEPSVDLAPFDPARFAGIEVAA